jgi:predicted small metal-binding protein
MTSTFVCSELGFVCPWSTTAESSNDVVAAASSHLTAAHKVEASADSLHAYVGGFVHGTNEGAADQASPNGTRRTPADSSLTARLRTVGDRFADNEHSHVGRGVVRYRMISQAGRASIIVVGVLAVVMVGLLYRTASNAGAIRDKTATIAQSGQGINEYADSIMQLNRTSELAEGAAKSVEPLQGDLSAIAKSSTIIKANLRSIDESSASIDQSASSINDHAGAIRKDVTTVADKVKLINASLAGVNTNATKILHSAEAMRRGVDLISTHLGRASRLASLILADSRGIDTRLKTSNHYAACIDNGLNGGSPC